MNQPNESLPAKQTSVTNQELKDPVHWGDFAAASHVSLMTPPESVLRAAFLDSVKPTEIAYVVVVNSSRKSSKKTKRHRLFHIEEPKEKAQYKLVVDKDEEEITKTPPPLVETEEDSSISASSIERRESFDSATTDSETSTCSETSNISSENMLQNRQPTIDCEETTCIGEGLAATTIEPSCLERESTPAASGDSLEDDESEKLATLKSKVASSLLNRLAEAERRERKLELQLVRAGITAVTEDIPFLIAKQKISEIAERMQAIDNADSEEYFKLEQEMDRYNAAIVLTDEWQEERDNAERVWEERNMVGNLEALKQVRRHMPVKVRQRTIDELVEPNSDGIALPVHLMKRFKRTDCLTLIRIHPSDIERMHPSMLESMRVTGLTLTERRALYAHLRETGLAWKKGMADAMIARKYKWFAMMKTNFKENLNTYEQHEIQYGKRDNHPRKCSTCPHGCPLIGKSCPMIADAAVDYSGDYGCPEGDAYEESSLLKKALPGVANSDEARLESARVERNSIRTAAFKVHYKGKLLQISGARASCELMDDWMEKLEQVIERSSTAESSDFEKLTADMTDTLREIKLALAKVAQRAGVQVTGKRGRHSKDTRCQMEVALTQEFISSIQLFCNHIECAMETMEVCKARSHHICTIIRNLNIALDEIDQRNKCIKDCSAER